MPTYEYHCKKCDKEFSVSIPLAEYDRKKVKCPECKGVRVERLLGTVSVKTSKKS